MRITAGRQLLVRDVIFVICCAESNAGGTGSWRVLQMCTGGWPTASQAYQYVKFMNVFCLHVLFLKHCRACMYVVTLAVYSLTAIVDLSYDQRVTVVIRYLRKH